MLASTFYPVNNVSNLEELAETMCYNIGAFPTTYLGLPLDAKLRSAEIRNGVTERFERRLATWQMKYLSMGDGLTVINNVFYLHILCLYSHSRQGSEYLDKIKTVLRECNSQRHKFHLVKGNSLTQPKLQGGLGIKDFRNSQESQQMHANEMAMEVQLRGT